MTVILLYYPFKSLTLLTLADNNFLTFFRIDIQLGKLLLY